MVDLTHFLSEYYNLILYGFSALGIVVFFSVMFITAPFIVIFFFNITSFFIQDMADIQTKQRKDGDLLLDLNMDL
jgi:hypothetical protein